MDILSDDQFPSFPSLPFLPGYENVHIFQVVLLGIYTNKKFRKDVEEDFDYTFPSTSTSTPQSIRTRIATIEWF